MKIFLISAVRSATPELLAGQEAYLAKLEADGHRVHYPLRDTDQAQDSEGVTDQNCRAMRAADEVHIWYNPESMGQHFDLGMCWAMGKKLVVAHNVPYEAGKKSYAHLIDQMAAWE